MKHHSCLAIRENRALIAWPQGAALDHVEVQFKAAMPGDQDWTATNPLAQLVAGGFARPSGPKNGHPLFRRHELTEAGEARRAKLRALVGLEATPTQQEQAQ